MANLQLEIIKEPLVYDDSLNIQTVCARRKEWICSTLKRYSRSQSLRVLIGTNSLACGGAEHQVMRLMPHLKTLGFEVEHLYYGAPHFLKSQFEVRKLVSHFLDRDAMGQLKFWKEAVAFIRRRRFDVVHSFGQTANFYVRGAAAAAGTPILIAGWRSRVMDNSLKWKIPVSFLNLFTSAWVVNAKTNLEALRCLWWPKKIKVYLLPNALDFHLKDFTKKEPFDSDIAKWIAGRLIVGIVGRIARPKNFDLFFDVAKIVSKVRKDVCFCLFGGPAGDADSLNLKEHLSKRIKEENLSSFIRMLGRYDNDRLVGLLPSLSILLCTSDFEGCPNAVLEGMRAKLPIVMTNCCDTRLIVEQGQNGYVVPKGHAGEMADRILELLSDREKRKKFGAHSVQMAESYFRAENAAWILALIYLKEWTKKQKKRR